MMHALFIVPLFFLFACEPTEVKGVDAGESGGAVSGSAIEEEPEKFAGLSDCLLSCERQDLSADDLATCRLSCDDAYGERTPAVAGAPSMAPVGEAFRAWGAAMRARAR